MNPPTYSEKDPLILYKARKLQSYKKTESRSEVRGTDFAVCHLPSRLNLQMSALRRRANVAAEPRPSLDLRPADPLL